MHQRLIRPLVYTGITAVVAFGMSGCFPRDQKHQDVSYGVTDQVRTLVIQGHTGEIKVTGTGSSVQVTEHQDYQDQRPATTHRTVDGTLTLGYDCSDCGVSYEVEVPAGTVVKVSTETGGVRLTGLAADIQASTQTGDIWVAVPAGAYAVTAKAQTGSIKVTFPQDPGAAHTITAKAQTGDVTVTRA